MKKKIKWSCETWICKCEKEWPEEVATCVCGGIAAEETRNSYDEFEWEFPAVNEVCGCCNGTGTTYLGWNNADQPAFTSEDFEMEGPDFREDYMSGAYDKTCPECNGNNVVLEIDHGHLSDADKLVLKSYESYLQGEYEYQQECAAERRMGC